MADEDRRFNFRYDRVLIESDRVLNPTLSGTTITLSGADLEMLRNITQYLHRPTSFVDVYETDTYLVPDDDDWYAIDAIVAELEYKLMGNDNTIWGYNAVCSQTAFKTVTIPGTNTFTFPSVPSGEVWRIAGFSFYCNTPNPTNVLFRPLVGGVTIYACTQLAVVTWQVYPFSLDIVMREGDYGYVQFQNAQIGDTVTGYLWGYKMAIPV